MGNAPQINHNNTSNTTTLNSTLRIRISFQILTIFLIVLVVSIFYFSDDNNGTGMSSLAPPSENNNSAGIARDTTTTVTKNDARKIEKCDYFSGKWVFDNQSYPLYKIEECSYMTDQLNCEKFGRKDLNYQNWRWQPHNCNLQRFNGTALLEKLRNKRLMYVGDSVNKNQWFSMICLVDSSIPPPLKSVHINGSLFTFKAIEYNATIEFYWEPLMVESNADHPVKHRVSERIARYQSIEKHARHWTDADLLIFDCYLWWKIPFMKILWGSFGSSDGIYKKVEMLKGYEMALRTWSDWLEIHVNHSKTRIFWMSMSPQHERSEEWGGKVGHNCYNETQPITKPDYWGSGSNRSMMRLVEVAIEDLSKKGLNITLLNITQLSEYRKDGHPSIHRRWEPPLSKEKLSKPNFGYGDCFHWCLPGVPDTWNEILYSYIV